MLDDDIDVPSGLATGHAARHARERDLVVIGAMPLIAPPPLTVAQALYRDDYAKWMARAQIDHGFALRHLWGGHVSIRRAHAVAVGMENPLFNGYRHEDLELGLRLAGAGLRGRFDPALRVEHRYARTVEQLLRDSWAQGREWAELRELHPEADLASPHDRYTAGLPLPLAVLVSLMSGRRTIAPSRRLLGAMRSLTSRTPSGRNERKVLQLSRRVEQLNGARSAVDTAGRALSSGTAAR